jgi:hypothetical protein
MDDVTSIIGVVITSIVVLITIATGILYYFIVYDHRKQPAQTGVDINIPTATARIKVSTTSF